MILCILGRQPELGLAELMALYPGKVTQFNSNIALVAVDYLDVQKLGGTKKVARVTHDMPHTDWAIISNKIIDQYTKYTTENESKLTIGFSAYDSNINQSQLYKLSKRLKLRVKQAGGSLRVIPSSTATLNTATSHHNKLGLSPNKKEVIITQQGRRTLIAESLGAQNITALSKRDQGRPKRDAFIGMLPPKLALMMYNIGVGYHKILIGKTNEITNTASGDPKLNILDPFCGTGVVLQEAYLRGAAVYGTDLNPKMVDFSQQNLNWLVNTYPKADGSVGDISLGNATSHTWPYAQTLNAVICETYLGQPFSATPSPQKLQQVRNNCNHIISQLLQNIKSQINPNTSLCIAVPAWRDLRTANITRLPLTQDLDKLGYILYNQKPLLYFREDQVVARDILILSRSS